MKKNIPTQDECLQIMKKYAMLENIIHHSIQVMNVSLKIYNSLQNKTLINKQLVTAAALLHDISKTEAIKTGQKHHDKMGGKFLRKLGFSKIAEIVEAHVYLENFAFDGPLEEREIIFYSDKRVMHDTIVTINERFDDLLVRYGTTEERIGMIEKNRAFSLKLEKKVDRFLTKPIDTLFMD